MDAKGFPYGQKKKKETPHFIRISRISIDKDSIEDEIPTLIKDLAEAISTAVEVQNRYWLAVAVTSLFVILPQFQSSSSPDKVVQLPFGLPHVDGAWYALLSVLLLSAFITAFSAAQAHLVRTQNLAYRILERRRANGGLIAGEDERYLLDALRKPSLGRVASLAQVVRGRQELKRPPLLRQIISTVLYVFFKIPILIVWLGLPVCALFYAGGRYYKASPLLVPFWSWLAWTMVITAAFALFIALCLEVQYIARALRQAW
ncbi:MAG: hypothetical protein NT166_00215 [Candidatus Aminicenantes bacterium]|nr:hypothetical protein [Candidatus Aminicenantes bacterium]